jgi:hypothetical protein
MPRDGWSRVKFAARGARPHALPLAVAITLALPLVIATIVLHSEPWAPVYDMALIEQKVRDVGTAHTPLLGLIGRLGPPELPAYHPGPLSFFLLAPVYRLLGGSAWALEASAAFLNAVAVATAVFIAWRRRSAAIVGLAGVGLALSMQGYGPSLLTEPWNPNFPVLWFAAFLAAIWSVACRDLAMLPVAVFAGSACAQTHIPYVPVCGALGALAALVAVIVIVRAAPGSNERKRGLGTIALSLGLLFVLWLPPVIEELRGSPGNVTRLVRFFSDPDARPVGLREALRLVFYRLNVKFLIVDQLIAPAGFNHPLGTPLSPLASGLTISFWIACALGAVVLRNRLLLTLHGLVLAGIGVAILAVSRIVGSHVGHVTFWSWELAMLLVVACLATIACAIARICPQRLRFRLAYLGPALALGAVVLCTLRLAWSAASVRPGVYHQTRLTKALARGTIEAILQGAGLATGRAGRYLVSWSDSMHAGALGIGLANELEREGLDVAYEKGFAALTGVHRTRDQSWATARIHFASGAWIAEARRVPGAVEASAVDLRTAEEKTEAEKLRAAIVNALRASGIQDLETIDYDLIGALNTHPPLHAYIIFAAGRLTDIGGPAAVFILPRDATPVRTVHQPHTTK